MREERHGCGLGAAPTAVSKPRDWLAEASALIVEWRMVADRQAPLPLRGGKYRGYVYFFPDGTPLAAALRTGAEPVGEEE